MANNSAAQAFLSGQNHISLLAFADCDACVLNMGMGVLARSSPALTALKTAGYGVKVKCFVKTSSNGYDWSLINLGDPGDDGVYLSIEIRRS